MSNIETYIVLYWLFHFLSSIYFKLIIIIICIKNALIEWNECKSINIPCTCIKQCKYCIICATWIALIYKCLGTTKNLWIKQTWWHETIFIQFLYFSFIITEKVIWLKSFNLTKEIQNLKKRHILLRDSFIYYFQLWSMNGLASVKIIFWLESYT